MIKEIGEPNDILDPMDVYIELSIRFQPIKGCVAYSVEDLLEYYENNNHTNLDLYEFYKANTIIGKPGEGFLKSIPALYIFLVDNCTKYIGRTKNMRNRLRMHDSKPTVFNKLIEDDFAHKYKLLIYYGQKFYNIERKLIQIYKPEYNSHYAN